MMFFVVVRSGKTLFLLIDRNVTPTIITLKKKEIHGQVRVNSNRITKYK